MFMERAARRQKLGITGLCFRMRQRRLEASMRRQKRRILADEATGDQEKKQQDQIKLQVLNQEYRRFSKAAGLRTQDARAEVLGFGGKQGVAAGLQRDLRQSNAAWRAAILVSHGWNDRRGL